MKTFVIDGVMVEVSKDSFDARVLEVVEYVKAHIDFLQTHKYDERDGYDWSILSKLVDDTWNTDYHSLVYNLYKEVNAIEDKLYRDYAEADFLEYAKHKNEDGFDWGFYSDWHKDIYGYRPR